MSANQLGDTLNFVAGIAIIVYCIGAPLVYWIMKRLVNKVTELMFWTPVFALASTADVLKNSWGWLPLHMLGLFLALHMLWDEYRKNGGGRGKKVAKQIGAKAKALRQKMVDSIKPVPAPRRVPVRLGA